MISRSTKICIIGLGLLGGSYAKGLYQAGYHVRGIDIDPEAISFAKRMHWIEEGGDDVSLVKDCDIVISALYPKTFISWIKENKGLLKKGAILTDVAGIKREVIEEINKELDSEVEFIACHPMAGREFKGIQYADCSLFEQANFLIVPTQENSQKAIGVAEDIAKILKFKHISCLSAEEHDVMIGFLSQLTHVIAVSLMNVNDNSHLAEYTGDSFRDLTRIAKINEELWPELFLLNQDNLVNEIDAFTQELQSFKSLLESGDIEGMKQKLITSTNRRKAFDKGR
ncbi:MAG: prephenate dehydrogenase [Solobacterium sp.]|nr:prephenate dehydrogenase [Solobacterium sp.]